jgi:uncharacterized membrane protein YcjF (UPF0283 family)
MQVRGTRGYTEAMSSNTATRRRRSLVPMILMMVLVAVTLAATAWVVVLVVAASPSWNAALWILGGLVVGVVALLSPMVVLSRMRQAR